MLRFVRPKLFQTNLEIDDDVYVHEMTCMYKLILILLTAELKQHRLHLSLTIWYVIGFNFYNQTCYNLSSLHSVHDYGYAYGGIARRAQKGSWAVYVTVL